MLIYILSGMFLLILIRIKLRIIRIEKYCKGILLNSFNTPDYSTTSEVE